MEFYKKTITNEDSLLIARSVRDLMKDYEDLRRYGVMFNENSNKFRVKTMDTALNRIKGDVDICLLSDFSVDETMNTPQIDACVNDKLKQLSFLERMMEMNRRAKRGKPTAYDKIKRKTNENLVDKPFNLLELNKYKMIKMNKKRRTQFFEIRIPINHTGTEEVIAMYPIGLKCTIFRNSSIVFVTKEEYNLVPIDFSGILEGKSAFSSLYETIDKAIVYKLGDGNNLAEQQQDVLNFNAELLSKGITDVSINSLQQFLY